MTVQELIEELKEMPPDAELIYEYDGQYIDISDCRLVRTDKRSDKKRVLIE